MLLRLLLVVVACAIFATSTPTPDLSLDLTAATQMLTAIAVDGPHQVLYVADFSSHRVLAWHNLSTITNTTAPDTVFGQPNFTSLSSGTSRSRLYSPLRICVDDQGTLWVLDAGNYRVLFWENAWTLGSGADATGVIGQEDFDSSVSATSLSNFKDPLAVWVYQDSIYVSEDSRVVRFDRASLPTTGATGDAVYGQPNATSSTDFGPSASSWSFSVSLCADARGMYVVDYNNRVMFFDTNALNTQFGASASFVLGQPNFASTASNTDVTGLHQPVSCYATGEFVFVADTSNKRVLLFEEPITANGQAAVAVFGPSNFTSTAGYFDGPSAVWYEQESNALWVGDGGTRIVYRIPYELATSSTSTTASSTATMMLVALLSFVAVFFVL